MVRYLLILLLMSLFDGIYLESLPTPTIEALRSGGLRITIPDNRYSSVTFHGFLNRTDSTKQWQMFVPRAKKGLWTMIDRNLELKINEKITFSIQINKGGISYPITGEWTVTKFVDEEQNPACVISETSVMCGKRMCKGELIFNEEFNEDSEEYQWEITTMFPQEPDYPFSAYLADTLKIEDNKLTIKPMLTERYRDSGSLYGHWDLSEDCTGEVTTSECYQVGHDAQLLPPVIGGKITTRNKFSFKYGRVEVRAKLPIGDWIIPEINLEPRDHEYGRLHYGSGLIRIAFVRGNQKFAKKLSAGAISYDTEPTRSMFLKNNQREDTVWGDDFHNYTLMWKPESIELLVDGEQYGTVLPNDDNATDSRDHSLERLMSAYKKGNDFAPLDKMFYISLGLRVGGINDFEDSDDKPWKNGSPKAKMQFWESKHTWHPTWESSELVVDYVKVYALE